MPPSSQIMHRSTTLLFIASILLVASCRQVQVDIDTNGKQEPDVAQDSTTEQEADTEFANTRSLFDGKTLGNWEQTNFGTEPNLEVVDGEIVMDPGYPIAGIHWASDEKIPTTNYEISLEAKRMEGLDFFCGLTFPVQDAHCSLIVAGWAGGTVGLSCVDDLDASSNETKRIMAFDDNRWYAIKVRVTDESITCWIDDEKVVEQKIAGHKISVRGDVVASKPLGLCAFESKVAYRNIELAYQDEPEDTDPKKIK